MILLISGKQGSGKTTLATGVCQTAREAGIEVHHLKFADPLYVMHDLIRDYLKLWAEAIPDYDFSVKDGPLLQVLGTDWGRKSLGADCWVRMMKATIQSIDNPAALIVIDDCRFMNELCGISPLQTGHNKVWTVRLECDPHDRKNRVEMWRDNYEHPSETGLDDCSDLFDLIINTGSTSATDARNIVCAALGL